MTTFIKMLAAALAGVCIGLLTVDMAIVRDAGLHPRMQEVLTTRLGDRVIV